MYNKEEIFFFQPQKNGFLKLAFCNKMDTHFKDNPPEDIFDMFSHYTVLYNKDILN